MTTSFFVPLLSWTTPSSTFIMIIIMKRKKKKVKGYWVYNLNHVSDWNQFEIILAEKDQVTDSIPWVRCASGNVYNNQHKSRETEESTLSIIVITILQHHQEQVIQLQQLGLPSKRHGDQQVSHHHNCFIFKELLSPISFTSMVMEMNNNSKIIQLLLSPSL